MPRPPLLLILICLFSFSLPSLHGADVIRLDTFQLADQFGKTNRVIFPRTRPLLLLVGDRRGSEQVDGWIPILREQWEHEVDILGLADVSAAPRFLRSRILEAIRRSRPQPILLDFEGLVAGRLRGTPRVANLFLVQTNGVVMAHVDGPPTPQKQEIIRQVLPPKSISPLPQPRSTIALPPNATNPGSLPR